MHDDPTLQRRETAQAGDQPLQSSVLLAGRLSISRDEQFNGTVGANVRLLDSHFYRSRSEMLTGGTPLPCVQGPAPSPGKRLRAKELTAEIHSINAQIHRIMFQVEKAVARLALGG